MEKKLLKIVRELLDHLGVKPKRAEVKKDAVGTMNLDLELDEKDAGILIGYHGDTIASLQLLLGMVLYKQTGQWVRLTVNIGDYRQKRSDYLTALAQDTAVRVVESGEPLALYSLNPFERRVVHLALAERGDVVTESQGEGKNRFLVVSPK